MNGWSDVGAGRKLGLPQLPTWSKDGATSGRKMGQTGLAPSSYQGLVGRWGRPVLRPGRSVDGAQHKYFRIESDACEW